MRRCALILSLLWAACRTAAPAPEGDRGQLEIEEAEGGGAQLRLSLLLDPVPPEQPTPRRGPTRPLELRFAAAPGRSDDAEVVARMEGASPRYGQCQELSASAGGAKVRLAQPRYFAQLASSGQVAEELRSGTSYENVQRLAGAPEVTVSVCADAFRASPAQRQTLQRFVSEWSARRR